MSHDHLRAAAGVGSAGAVSVGAAPFVVLVSAVTIGVSNHSTTEKDWAEGTFG